MYFATEILQRVFSVDGIQRAWVWKPGDVGFSGTPIESKWEHTPDEFHKWLLQITRGNEELYSKAINWLMAIGVSPQGLPRLPDTSSTASDEDAAEVSTYVFEDRLVMHASDPERRNEEIHRLTTEKAYWCLPGSPMHLAMGDQHCLL